MCASVCVRARVHTHTHTCMCPHQHISINHKDSAMTQEKNVKLCRFQLLRMDLKSVSSELLMRTRGLSQTQDALKEGQCLHLLSFCHMDFPEEREGGLTGSQSISHRVSAEAGTGDVLEAVEEVCVRVCMCMYACFILIAKMVLICLCACTVLIS